MNYLKILEVFYRLPNLRANFVTVPHTFTKVTDYQFCLLTQTLIL